MITSESNNIYICVCVFVCFVRSIGEDCNVCVQVQDRVVSTNKLSKRKDEFPVTG